MKGLFRSFAFHIVSLWLVASYVGGIYFDHDLKVLATAALALTLVDSLIKPFINLLLLPLNLVTLGTFRWLSSVATLYITTLIVARFSVMAFNFAGFSSNLFIIPSLSFSLLWAYVFLAIIISTIVSFLFWITK